MYFIHYSGVTEIHGKCHSSGWPTCEALKLKSDHLKIGWSSYVGPFWISLTKKYRIIKKNIHPFYCVILYQEVALASYAKNGFYLL